jgi:2-oxoisovalerate dehydrogenase E2 component (dihydrolipoyl transacylase)
MAFELKMPKLGESVTEGTIGKWLKQPGEPVKKYDLLVEVQTDKVNTEIPSEIDGTLSEIKVQEGETVSVGTVLAVFDTAGSGAQPTDGAAPASAPSASAPSDSAPSTSAPSAAAAAAQPPAEEGRATAAPAAAEAPAAAQQAPAQQATEPPPPTAPAAGSDGSGNGRLAPAPDVRATPAVRKLAAEHAIDLAQVTGTGLGGRVSRQDVEAFIASRGTAPAPAGAAGPAPSAAASPQAAPPGAAAAPPGGDTTVPLTQMRRAIAANMVQAWSAPHAHAVMEVDMTELMRFRDTVKGDFQKREGFDLSPAAFIVKATVEALASVRAVNSSWTDQGLVLRKAINVGYAVALGDEGLVVPVIRDADGMSITGLMRAIRDVVDRAKTKKLTLDDFQGGTFTVNNTGPLGTFVSSPIVPPGQAAIVSSESIRKRLVVMDDDSIAIRQMMNLVIGFDHRAIDGSTAARFLAAMRDWLQAVNATCAIT